MNGIVCIEPEQRNFFTLEQSNEEFLRMLNRRVNFAGSDVFRSNVLEVHIDHALKFESIPYLEHLYSWLVYHTKFMHNEEAKYLMRMLRVIIRMELESLRQKSLKTPT